MIKKDEVTSKNKNNKPRGRSGSFNLGAGKKGMSSSFADGGKRGMFDEDEE